MLYHMKTNKFDMLFKQVECLKKVLESEGYVPRTLYKEGMNPFTQGLLPRLFKEHYQRTGDIILDSALFPSQRMVIIGNAGAGKTFIIYHAFIDAVQQFHGKPKLAPLPFLLDFDGDLASNLKIEEALNQKYDNLFMWATQNHIPGYFLFLDSLDEKVLKDSHRFAKDVENFLCNTPKLTGYVIGCRRSSWQSDWFKNLSPSPTTFQSDYLGMEEYGYILKERNKHKTFFRKCDQLGISGLLDNPFDGFHLARNFADGENLPRTRRECIEERIIDCLHGVSRDRTGEEPSIKRLRFLSMQLACIATFTKQTSWTHQEAIDSLGDSSALQTNHKIKSQELQSLFQRPLFKRQGDRFSFTHQLYREFLTAEALKALSLRKQCQLLEANILKKICTPYRGVAAQLAEVSKAFREHVMEYDPLVAFLTEAPHFTSTDEEKLLKRLLDQFVAEPRLPWWEIRPGSIKPLKLLPKHQPQNIEKFLKPYLKSPNEISRLWATACAVSWGGTPAINPILNKLAHDITEREETRVYATEAIIASKEKKDIRKLFDLLNDKNDGLRGYVLRAYRQIELPMPEKYLEKLIGGANDKHLLSSLQMEAEAFGLSLNAPGLGSAFKYVENNFDALQDLRCVVLGGLIERAVELRFHNVPPSLIVKLWTAHDTGSVHYDKHLRQLLQQEKRLFKRLWWYIMQILKSRSDIYPFEMAEYMAPYCDEAILDDVLPAQTRSFTEAQQSFILDVLHEYFNQNPNRRRLQFSKKKAPQFTQYIRLAEAFPAKPERSTVDISKSVANALDGKRDNAVNRTYKILKIIAEAHNKGSFYNATEEDVESALKNLPSKLSTKILAVFRKYINSITFSKVSHAGSKELEIPFWILKKRGVKFSPKKLSEIICTYGFFETGIEKTDPYEMLLEEIKQVNRTVWERCVLQMMNDQDYLHDIILHYLSETNEDVYVNTCGKCLSKGEFTEYQLPSLLNYWQKQKPADYCGVLRACYISLRKHLKKQKTRNVSSRWAHFRPLILLMAEDDTWAWKEFLKQLRRGGVPAYNDFYDVNISILPSNPKYLPVLSEWYALIQKNLKEECLSAKSLSTVIMSIIKNIGGEPAIKELRRLQHSKAFPNAQWLSYDILQIEDRLLIKEKELPSTGNLLDFINKSSMSLILSEADLFETVCQALEEIQKSFEKDALGIAGFWNGNNPKEEPECQNVLWPLVKQKLTNFGVVDIEEKYVGPNECDLFVMYPRPHNTPFQVAVELKVARLSYGVADLVEPIENQLWKKYLHPSGCQHGIYIVLWFKDNKRYKGPKHWRAPADLLHTLKNKSENVAVIHSIVLQPYVFDMTRKYRGLKKIIN